MTYPAKHISISINLEVNEVYQFISNPLHLSQWAEGLSQSTLQKEGDYWMAASPMGEVKVKFCEKNIFGVVDHDVVLPSGEVNHNPMRVVRNGRGSEVIFTLFHLPRMSAEDFNRDSEFIERDLRKLKSILEK